MLLVFVGHYVNNFGTRPMNTRSPVIVTLPAALFAICLAGTSHATDPIEELKVCARMTDQDVRYACYDRLGQRLLEDESPESPALPDDIGGADFTDQPQQEVAKEDRGRVTSCTKGRDGRWYFVFDNGQVWKESNTSRNRFKNCEFVAYIYRDSFGYKMRIGDDGKKLRVRRVR